MSSLQKIIYLKREQYETLLSNNNTGQVQYGGVTLTGVQDDNIYFITDETVSASDLGDDFILPVDKGGTGRDRFTVGSVPVGNGTAAMTELAATNQNTANTLVKRDGTGSFYAGTVTATTATIGSMSLTSTVITGVTKVLTNGYMLLGYKVSGDGVTAEQWSVGTSDRQGVIRTAAAQDLLHSRGSATSTIIDTGNYSSTVDTRFYKLDGSNTGTKLVISTNIAAYTNGIQFTNSGTVKGSFGVDNTGISAVYGASKVVLRPQLNASTTGVEVTTAAMYPTGSMTLGTSGNKWSTAYATTLDATTLKLHQGTGQDPATDSRGRIEFDYSGGQAISISYTPNNSYREPAGLKLMGNGSISGNDIASPAWFEVEGSIFANGGVGNKGYRVPHTGNANGSVGGTTTPVYVDAGQIKAGTALKDLAYIDKPTSDTTTTYLRGDGSWVGLSDMGLSSAMHYRGAVSADPTTTTPTGTYESGDVLVNSTNSKEFVYDGTSWREIGDESSFALSGHDHPISISATGTATVTLAASTTYTLTAGGSSIVFKTPADNKGVTKVSTGAGLTGGDIITTGTISINGMDTSSGSETQCLTKKGTWKDFNNYSLTVSTTSALGGVKVAYQTNKAATVTPATYTTTPTIQARSTSADRSYGVEADKNGVLFVTVPWTNVNSSYLTSSSNVAWNKLTGVPTASNTTAGIVLLGAENGAATYGHTHSTTLTQTGSSAITLAANTVYTLTAGGNSVAFTTPPDADTIPAAYCDTASGTKDKVAKCTDYEETANTWIHIIMKNSNTNTAATLSINGKTKKAIKVNGVAPAASGNNQLKAGSYLAFYDGSNYLFRTDGKLPGDISGDAATVNSHTVSADVPSDAVFTDHYDWDDITSKPDNFTPSSHTHGNISNTGTVGTGNALLSTDGGVVTASITIGTGTTKFLREDGEWIKPSYTTNTDEKVKQTSTTTAAAYKLLLSNTSNPTSGTAYGTFYSTTLTYNPSTKALVTGGSVDGLTLAAQATGFKISGGSTTSKTLTLSENIELKAGSSTYLAYYNGANVLTSHTLAHFSDEFGSSVANKKNELVLGNATAKATNGSAFGQLALYSSGTKGTYLNSAENSTAWYTATLQAKAGTIALTSDITVTSVTATGTAPLTLSASITSKAVTISGSVATASSTSAGVVKLGTESTNAAAGNHSHGQITNTGTISTSAAAKNGDAIVISTSADSGLVKKLNITFDASTTTEYLNKKGSWGTPPDTKNTAGATATTSKIYLVGSTTQTANPQTYSTTYVHATDGVMSAKSFGINYGTADNKVTLQWNNTDSALEFVFA